MQVTKQKGGKPTMTDSIIGALIVDNPAEYAERVVNPKIAAIRSLRDDPLGRLHDRGQIEDALFKAGRHWQAVYEDTGYGRIPRIDPTNEPVDGSRRLPQGLTDRMARAIREIARFDRLLGQDGAALIRNVLAERMFMGQVIERRGLAGTSRQLDYFARRLKECLETLAKEMGYA